MSHPLDQEIHDKTWLGHFWGSEQVLEMADKRLAESQGEDRVQYLSSISSTYYAASGNAFSRAAKYSWRNPFNKLEWIIKGLYTIVEAHKYSRAFKEEVGMEKMTANQLDVASRISIAMRRYRDAFEEVSLALKHNDLSFDTKVLLFCTRAELLTRRGEFHEALDVYVEALKLVAQIKPTTAVRLHRSHARYYLAADKKDLAKRSLDRALDAAIGNDLRDQVVKINAEMRKCQ